MVPGVRMVGTPPQNNHSRHFLKFGEIKSGSPKWNLCIPKVKPYPRHSSSSNIRGDLYVWAWAHLAGFEILIRKEAHQ